MERMQPQVAREAYNLLHAFTSMGVAMSLHRVQHRAFHLMAPVGAAVALALASCSQNPATFDDRPPAPPVEVGPPVFEDVTAASGIAFTYRNGEEASNFAIIESLGGGIALLDYDHDGLPDVFIPGGGHYDGKKVVGNPCKLYRNLGGFHFEDVTERAGLASISFPYSHGAAVFDYDCDGWPDILVTGYNRLLLLHNESDGKGGRRFVDVTAAAKLDDRLWSSTAAWGDLDGDGYPDIYVSHYGNWGFDANHPTDCTYDGKTRDVCQPKRFEALPHTIYHNNRDGTFTDATAKLGLRKDGKGMQVLIVDVNNDGRPDIYVANDTDAKFLYLNRGKKGELSLQEEGKSAGVAIDDRGNPNGSMGLDAGDYNRSGLASLFVTNYENELPALYTNRSTTDRTHFVFNSLATGIGAVGGGYVSWGTGFFDYDLDGWEDLLIVSGHAIRYPTKIDRRQKPVLLKNQGGRFAIRASGGPYFQSPHNARGCAFGDLDNDGKVDLVISHLNEPVVVLHNVADTTGKHWVGIDLEGRNHRDVVGARVVIETAGGRQTKFAKGGGSFASSNDPRMVFGLGPDTKIEKATVYWSWGEAQTVAGLEADGYWRVVEGEAAAKKGIAGK